MTSYLNCKFIGLRRLLIGFPVFYTALANTETPYLFLVDRSLGRRWNENARHIISQKDGDLGSSHLIRHSVALARLNFVTDA
jgi:hypothetical protein